MLGELTPREVEDLLRSEFTGRIGCHAEGRTYVVPITYVYQGGYVYCHSAEGGLKLQLMRKNPDVCFEVDRVTDMGNWKSVIASGRYEELGGRHAIEAMDILIGRFAGVEHPERAHPSYVLRAADTEPARVDGREIVLFRIHLADKTGRFERTPA